MPEIIKYSSNKKNVSKKDRISLFDSLFRDKRREYKIQKSIDSIEYLLVNKTDDSNYQSIGLNYGKQPLNLTRDVMASNLIGLRCIETKEITLDLFNDIYKLSRKRDFDNLTRITKNYLKKWSIKSNPLAPKFPVVIIEQPNLCTEFKTADEFINSNYVLYNWDGGEFLIDSDFKQFETEYWNFGHPTGIVLPKKALKTWRSNEITKLVDNLEDSTPNWLS